MTYHAGIKTRSARGAAALLASVLLTGCGSSPTAPSATTVPSGTGAGEAYAVSGWVADSAGRRLAGVTLTVVDGPRAGATTASDERGDFRFADLIPYPASIRASRVGYVDQIRTFRQTLSQAGTVAFELESARTPPVSLRGRYSVTFSADPGCTLPELLSRTYTAEISATGPRYDIVLTGGSFAPGLNMISVSAFEDFATLLFVDDGESSGIKETVPPNTHVSLSGQAAGTVHSEGFELSWTGWYWYGPYGCPSNNHRIRFSRIG